MRVRGSEEVLSCCLERRPSATRCVDGRLQSFLELRQLARPDARLQLPGRHGHCWQRLTAPARQQEVCNEDGSLLLRKVHRLSQSILERGLELLQASYSTSSATGHGPSRSAAISSAEP